MRIYFAILAGVLGLAFGSFLNVCLSRWPAGESVVKPRSHCRACGRTLTWWENVPLVSWLALRGRCRSCGVWIGWRYVVVELAVGGLWSWIAWQRLGPFLSRLAEGIPLRPSAVCADVEIAVGMGVFCFLMVGLVVLDAQFLWLPDIVTLPGTGLGILYSISLAVGSTGYITVQPPLLQQIVEYLFGILVAAGIVLLIRWLYWLVRRREGIGLGDAKLMAMLGAWLGLQGALLAFALGVFLAAIAGVVVLLRPAREGDGALPHLQNQEMQGTRRGLAKLPLGTFLCIGGIVSSLWGGPILDAYLRWTGLQ
jgi:leader peptidase (prepilin peptidase) / N-methyltransferase